jgi:YidC/Oxa1 family membrane protein insertase
MISTLFNEILYRPLLNALIFLYNTLAFADLGIAIILLTVIIRLILFPLFYKGAKDQTIIQRLTPKIKEIQKNHKEDKQKQAMAMMELYKEHKVNPFSGFLLLLIQLPVLIALYWVFLKGISEQSLAILYSFVSRPAVLEHYFLGLIDLSAKNIIVVVAAALVQYFQGKLSLPKNNKPIKDLSPAERIGRQMVFIGPVLTLVILYNLPSAVGLYWLTTSLFSLIQQIVINKRIKNNES